MQARLDRDLDLGKPAAEGLRWQRPLLEAGVALDREGRLCVLWLEFGCLTAGGLAREGDVRVVRRIELLLQLGHELGVLLLLRRAQPLLEVVVCVSRAAPPRPAPGLGGRWLRGRTRGCARACR